MTATSKIGYIDEYGDKSIHFEKSGVSIYFIVTAIIVDKVDLERIEHEINELRPKYTQAPEIKSNSKAFKDINKRLQFLTDLSKLDFKIYSVIVDKRKIFENSGLRFRESFFKYINNLLDSDLYLYFPYLEIVSDEHGSEKFMNGFIEYVKDQHKQYELFRKPEFRFGDSKKEILIQLADFISGSLARCYDPDKRIENPNLILDILKKNILHLREWPETNISALKNSNDIDEQFNPEIATFALNQINHFISSNEKKSDDFTKNLLICLHYLVFRFRNNPFIYILSDEIIDRICVRGITLSKRVFTKDVIGTLRDQGILITSSQIGYKIPCSKADLIRFFNNYTTKIIPMIETLDQCNVLTKTATSGSINLLDDIREFEIIKVLINAIKASR